MRTRTTIEIYHSLCFGILFISATYCLMAGMQMETDNFVWVSKLFYNFQLKEFLHAVQCIWPQTWSEPALGFDGEKKN